MLCFPSTNSRVTPHGAHTKIIGRPAQRRRGAGVVARDPHQQPGWRRSSPAGGRRQVKKKQKRKQNIMYLSATGQLWRRYAVSS